MISQSPWSQRSTRWIQLPPSRTRPRMCSNAVIDSAAATSPDPTAPMRFTAVFTRPSPSNRAYAASANRHSA